MIKVTHVLKQIIVGLFALLFTVSCEHKADYSHLEEHVGKISTLTELGTVEYVISKIVKADDNATWYKFGDRKILFSCKAIIKAGIDLSNLTANDIETNFERSSITIKLPAAKLLFLNMKPEDITLVYEKISITRSSFSNAERDAVLAQAERDIRESVRSMGILDDAQKNARLFLESFLKQAGFTEVNIEFNRR